MYFMKLFTFLDIKYQETALKLSKEYCPYHDGHAKAAQTLIGWMRNIGKWSAILGLLYEFVLVKVSYIPQPVHPLAHKKHPPKEKPEVLDTDTPVNEAH